MEKQSCFDNRCVESIETIKFTHISPKSGKLTGWTIKVKVSDDSEVFTHE